MNINYCGHQHGVDKLIEGVKKREILYVSSAKSYKDKCSAAHCDSVATAFCDTNVASPQTPTSIDPSKHKTNDPVQPFLQTFPQRKHGERFTAVQICI